MKNAERRDEKRAEDMGADEAEYRDAQRQIIKWSRFGSPLCHTQVKPEHSARQQEHQRVHAGAGDVIVVEGIADQHEQHQRSSGRSDKIPRQTIGRSHRQDAGQDCQNARGSQRMPDQFPPDIEQHKIQRGMIRAVTPKRVDDIRWSVIPLGQPAGVEERKEFVDAGGVDVNLAHGECGDNEQKGQGDKPAGKGVVYPALSAGMVYPPRYSGLVYAPRYSGLVYAPRYSSLVYPPRYSSLVYPALSASLVYPPRYSGLVYPPRYSSLVYPALSAGLVYPPRSPHINGGKVLAESAQQHRIHSIVTVAKRRKAGSSLG